VAVPFAFFAVKFEPHRREGRKETLTILGLDWVIEITPSEARPIYGRAAG